MKKLKNILQYNYLYYILLILSIIYVISFNLIIKKNSYYSLNDNYLYGYIIEKNIDGDKLTLTIKAKEKVIVNYYFKSEKELNNFNIKYGDYVKIYGTFNKPKNNTNFNLFNYKKYLYYKKIYYIISANKIIKTNKTRKIYNLKNIVENRIEKCIKSKHYLKAFILGNKKDINYQYNEEYQKLGISHLFAISGMHITFLSSVLLFILNKNNYKYFLVDIFLIIYAFITGLSSSVIRATILFILYSINKKLNLKIKTINILILLFSILIIINPYYIYDIGFIFSFSICFSLIIYSKKLKEKNYIKKVLKVSTITYLISLPIVINNFYSINLLSILFNVIYVPYISLIVFPLSIITFIFPFLDNFLYLFLNVLELLTKYFSLLNTNIYFSKQPIILIITYYIFLYLILTYSYRKYYIFLFINIIIFYLINIYVTPRITFLDVGQGDSILIRINNKNILLDTGGKVSFNNEKWREKNKNETICKNILLPFMKSVGVKKIDYLILSHGDFDHMGEAINLVNNFKVENVIFNCGPYNNLENELIEVLDKKKIPYYSCIKKLNIDKNKLYFLQTSVYDNENDNSNVISTELNDYKFLFMGDASSATEKEVLSKYSLTNIDVLKVGHHGSKTSSSKEFINEINPKYSIISVGKNNRYGHPNKDALDNLEESKIYRTDEDGSIMFKIKNSKLKIETCSP